MEGSKSLEQYAARFMKLGKFAPHLVSTEKLQAQNLERFVDKDLHPNDLFLNQK